ncbi:hypothetical protein GGI24_004016, partial [Coemansia furcata]
MAAVEKLISDKSQAGIHTLAKDHIFMLQDEYSSRRFPTHAMSFWSAELRRFYAKYPWIQSYVQAQHNHHSVSCEILQRARNIAKEECLEAHRIAKEEHLEATRIAKEERLEATRIAKEERLETTRIAKEERLEATRIAKEAHRIAKEERQEARRLATETRNLPVAEWLAKLNADFPNILPSRMYNVDEMLLEFVIE